MKKSIYYIRASVAFILCVFGITFTFINSNTIANFLAKTLKLKITPSYIGGEIAADFYDDSGDDKGSGTLKYPSNKAFEENSLDLIRYTVHKPVYEAKWQMYPEYWQLDLEYKNGTSDVRNIMIYIDIDGNENGCMETLFEGAENICFDSKHPWDYAIWICENQAKIYDSQKNFLLNAQISILKDGKQIIVRIPLQDKNFQRIYSSSKTYHYVVTGGFSKFDRGGFMPIEKRRTISHGGTEKASDFNNLIPKIYDILGDNSQLGKWNADELTKAVIIPVEADMQSKSLKYKDMDSDENTKFISEIKAKAATISTSSFGEGFETLDELENYYENKVKENPEDAESLAYYASCVAMRGGEASVVQAVNLVNKSFELFDKAISLATSENEFEVYLNRANVCAAVPDGVFAKAETGGKDFLKCAALSKQKYPDKPELTAYLYICASECFHTAGKETESILAIQEAKKVMYNGVIGE